MTEITTDTAAPVDDIPESLTITLRKPIEHGGLTYETIQLREPTADEWARWDGKSGVEADIIAVSTVAGIPQAAVRKLTVRDLLQASRYLGRFLD
jgi:hypothetical protein